MPSTEHKTEIFTAKGDEFNQQVAQMDQRLSDLTYITRRNNAD